MAITTRFVDVSGTKFAYSLVGPPSTSSTPPLVLLQHFRGSMRHWNPALLSLLSRTRPVLLIDYAGVGQSTGYVRDNFLDSAKDIISMLKALNITTIDLFGFSIGCFVAQLVTLEAPDLVRKLILAGTGPSAGEGLESGPQQIFMDFMNATMIEENEKIYLSAFFTSNPAKQAKGKEWWKRIYPNIPSYLQNGEDGYLGAEGTKKQVEAIVKWVSGAGTDGTPVRKEEKSYERLGDVKSEVLIIAGKEDEVVPVANSLMLFKKIRQARLWVGEDVGHGVLIEYAREVASEVDFFLGT